MLMSLLLQAASVVAAPAPADDPNKLICRREAVTGSRAGRRKVCHTRAEWQQMADTARNTANELRTVPQSSQN